MTLKLVITCDSTGAQAEVKDEQLRSISQAGFVEIKVNDKDTMHMTRNKFNEVFALRTTPGTPPDISQAIKTFNQQTEQKLKEAPPKPPTDYRGNP